MATSSPPADGDLIEMIVDDEVLSFSKALLIQSSPFFEHTFMDGQLKKKRVVISGVSGQTFKHLLGYMKSGKLELSCNNVADIFHAACKLQMPNIIRQCIEMEACTSAVGKQIILYKAAKRVNNVEERNAAFYRMVSNFTLVTQSDEFLELDAKDVYELLSSDVLSCERELDVFNAARRWLNYKVDTRLSLTSRLMYCVRFPLMSLMELSHCVEADTPPGLQDDHNVRVMILSAVCFWVAKAAGKEAEVGHLACMPRHYIKKDPEVPADELERAMTCGNSEQPSLLSVSLGAAKARLQPVACSKVGGTQELQVTNVLESRHLCGPKHSVKQEASLLLHSSTAECDSSMDSVAPTVCESSIRSILSSDAQTTCPSTQESDRASVTQDSCCTYSPSEFCSPSDDDKDQLSSQSIDSVILTGHSDGDRVHRDNVANLKAKVLLGSQRGFEHEALLRRSSLLSQQPKAHLLVVNENPKNSAIPPASVSMEVEYNFSEAPCKDGEQGTLFLIGGVEPDESPSMCPILSYSIKGNTWSSRKILPVHSYGHKAVFLNGCIYIIGGFENFSPVNLERASSRCCFWFEVSSGKWGIMAPLNNTRAYHGLAVLDKTIYAIGGVDSNNRLLGCLERYDKEKDEWTKLSGELYSPRMAMGFCSHKRQLWVAGGIVQIGRRTCSTAYVEVYNPETERWAFAVNFLPSPRSCLTLVECGGTMYAVGGLLSHRCGGKRNFTTVEDMLAFVDERKTWVHRAPMPNARHSTVAAAHDGVVFIIGGRQAERPDYHYDNILAYDTKLDKWMTLGNLPKNVTDYHCVLVPPEQPSDNLRELLTSRGDHRSPTKMAERFPVTAPDVKSYSQGDIAVRQQYK